MKRSFALILTAVMMFCCLCGAAAANNVAVTINGAAVQFNQNTGYPFVDSNNRTLVPLRGAMEKYGCNVGWDGSAKTALVEKNDRKVKVPLNADYIYVDGKRVQNDTEAINKDGRIYLPIRIVLEAFGAKVNWNNDTSTVVVTAPGVIPSVDDLQVHFMDVGQADAILIDYNQYEVLIDAGRENNGAAVVDYLKKYVDGNLDLLIASHADADHIGGMAEVIKSCQVNKIIDSGQVKDTAVYKKYMAVAEDEPNCELIYDDDMIIDMGNGVCLKIIETGDNHSETNNNSVVALLSYDGVKVLFTGDMEADTEKANLKKFSDIDVLKAGHHGSASSSCKEFMQVIKPEYVVVSAGLNNSYGHPSALTLSNYFSINAKVLGTFKSGNIILTTDGQSYEFNSEAYLTINDAGGKSEDTDNNDGSISGGTDNQLTADNARYIGNKSTKKIHLKSCRYAAQISSQNVVYFKTRAEAAGYVPCKVCNP
jgi:competence protein ComEC